uniref:endonuclease III domain-containing protein n=1 Tax=Chlamydia suis TaxID=83559 RepID=UPI00356B7337
MNEISGSSKRFFILNTLNRLFPSPEPSLKGWHSPFQLLIAILLSGNSTDKAVNTVTPALFAKAPDAKSMSALAPSEIYSFIAPCGLGEQKANYIHKLSHIL